MCVDAIDATINTRFDEYGDRSVELYLPNGRRATGPVIRQEADRYVGGEGSPTDLGPGYEMPGVAVFIHHDAVGGTRALTRTSSNSEPIPDSFNEGNGMPLGGTFLTEMINVRFAMQVPSNPTAPAPITSEPPPPPPEPAPEVDIEQAESTPTGDGGDCACSGSNPSQNTSSVATRNPTTGATEDSMNGNARNDDLDIMFQEGDDEIPDEEPRMPGIPEGEEDKEIPVPFLKESQKVSEQGTDTGYTSINGAWQRLEAAIKALDLDTFRPTYPKGKLEEALGLGSTVAPVPPKKCWELVTEYEVDPFLSDVHTFIDRVVTGEIARGRNLQQLWLSTIVAGVLGKPMPGVIAEILAVEDAVVDSVVATAVQKLQSSLSTTAKTNKVSQVTTIVGYRIVESMYTWGIIIGPQIARYTKRTYEVICGVKTLVSESKGETLIREPTRIVLGVVKSIDVEITVDYTVTIEYED